MSSLIVHWDQTIQHAPQVKVAAIENFSARGMRRVYGRGDRFKNWTLSLDLWKTKDGRLLARFWSRSQEVDWESWEVIGLEQADYSYADERWVPWCLRKAYDNWVLANC